MEKEKGTKDDNFFAKVRIDADEVKANLAILNEERDIKGQKIRYINKSDVVKLIVDYTGDTYALVNEMYRYVEDAIKFFMASVEENERVVIRAFSGITFMSEYIPGKMSDKFRAKGNMVWVQPQVKSKITCSRRLNENLSAKFRDGIIGGNDSTKVAAFPNVFLDYENLEDEVKRVARKIQEEESFINKIDSEEEYHVDKNERIRQASSFESNYDDYTEED